MRTRRLLSAIAVAACVPLLAGCGVLGLLTPPTRTPTGPLEVGACLDHMNGYDSDRRSVVDCAQPHLFEVTQIVEWPGMDDAVASAEDAGVAWDHIHTLAGTTGSTAEYATWASTTCNQAAQKRIGIDDVVVDDHTAADLWLRVGGHYGVDLSLGSRAEFVAGDHRTVCALTWYEDGSPALAAEPSFTDLMGPGFDLDRRDCWANDYQDVPCTNPHALQVLLEFDGSVPFDEEMLIRAGNGEATDDDWTLADDFCEELLLQTLPFDVDLDPLGFIAEVESATAWDEFDGTIDTDLGGYWYACIAGDPDGRDFTGDVFDGSVAVGGAAA